MVLALFLIVPGTSNSWLKMPNAPKKGKRLVALSAKTPGLNAKVPRSVRLRRVCSERCAWDRDAQGNLGSAAGRSRGWPGRSRRNVEACADALAATRRERPPRRADSSPIDA